MSFPEFCLRSNSPAIAQRNQDYYVQSEQNLFEAHFHCNTYYTSLNLIYRTLIFQFISVYRRLSKR